MATLASGFRFLVQGGGDESPTWSKIWKVHVKVAYGRARQGIQCLSFYVKQTGHVGFAVGKFSGEVGRSVSAMPSDNCVHRVALFSMSLARVPSYVAIAGTSIAPLPPTHPCPAGFSRPRGRRAKTTEIAPAGWRHFQARTRHIESPLQSKLPCDTPNPCAPRDCTSVPYLYGKQTCKNRRLLCKPHGMCAHVPRLTSQQQSDEE